MENTTSPLNYSTHHRAPPVLPPASTATAKSNSLPHPSRPTLKQPAPESPLNPSEDDTTDNCKPHSPTSDMTRLTAARKIDSSNATTNLFITLPLKPQPKPSSRQPSVDGKNSKLAHFANIAAAPLKPLPAPDLTPTPPVQPVNDPSSERLSKLAQLAEIAAQWNAENAPLSESEVPAASMPPVSPLTPEGRGKSNESPSVSKQEIDPITEQVNNTPNIASPSVISWTQEEDDALVEIASRWKSVRWKTASFLMHERGFARDVPDLKRRYSILHTTVSRPPSKQPWTAEEDDLLFRASSKWVRRVRWRQVASALEERGYNRSTPEMRERLEFLRNSVPNNGNKTPQKLAPSKEAYDRVVEAANGLLQVRFGTDSTVGTQPESLSPSFSEEQPVVNIQEPVVADVTSEVADEDSRESEEMAIVETEDENRDDGVIVVVDVNPVKLEEKEKGMPTATDSVRDFPNSGDEAEDQGEVIASTTFVPARQKSRATRGSGNGGKATRPWTAQEDDILRRCLRRRKSQEERWDHVALYLRDHGFRRSQRACQEHALRLHEEIEEERERALVEGREIPRVLELPSGPPRKRPRGASIFEHRRWCEREHILYMRCIARYASGNATWDDVADWMKQGGFPRSRSACQQHMRRIKEMADEHGTNLNDYILQIVTENERADEVDDTTADACTEHINDVTTVAADNIAGQQECDGVSHIGGSAPDGELRRPDTAATKVKREGDADGQRQGKIKDNRHIEKDVTDDSSGTGTQPSTTDSLDERDIGRQGGGTEVRQSSEAIPRSPNTAKLEDGGSASREAESCDQGEMSMPMRKRRFSDIPARRVISGVHLEPHSGNFESAPTDRAQGRNSACVVPPQPEPKTTAVTTVVACPATRPQDPCEAASLDQQDSEISAMKPGKRSTRKAVKKSRGGSLEGLTRNRSVKHVQSPSEIGQGANSASEANSAVTRGANGRFVRGKVAAISKPSRIGKGEPRKRTGRPLRAASQQRYKEGGSSVEEEMDEVTPTVTLAVTSGNSHGGTQKTSSISNPTSVPSRLVLSAEADPFFDSLSESDGNSSLGDAPIRGELGEISRWVG